MGSEGEVLQLRRQRHMKKKYFQLLEVVHSNTSIQAADQNELLKLALQFSTGIVLPDGLTEMRRFFVRKITSNGLRI